jgi:hypothetical protein
MWSVEERGVSETAAFANSIENDPNDKGCHRIKLGGPAFHYGAVIYAIGPCI